MDLASIIASIAQIPGVGPYMVWISFGLTTAVTLCSILSTSLPAPRTTSGAYYLLYRAVGAIALLKGHATPLTDPKVAGLVAGPDAISNPRIAITTTPK